MSRSVTFKLRGPALEAALKFSHDLGMPLNLAAERALLWAIRKAYEPDEETPKADGQALSPIAVGTGAEESPGPDAAGSPLAQP